MATKWPRNNQAELKAFYGDPAKNEVEPQLVYIYPPWSMYYPEEVTDANGRKTIRRAPVTKIRVHKKCAAAFNAAFAEIWLAFGKSQAAIDKAGLNEYNGAYEKRLIRGSNTNWSNHSFGAAIDINASKNPLGATTGQMPQEAIDAFIRQGMMWGGYYTGRKDLMHFECMDNGGRQPKNRAPTGNTAAANVVAVPEEKEADPILEELQNVLIDMGYFEVGKADGLDGGKTQGAIKAFLTDCHLESYTTFETLLDFAKRRKASGFMRPVAPARAYATVEDIAPKVASVQANKSNRLVGKIMAIPSAVGGAVWGAVSFVPDAYNTASPYINIAKEYVDVIPGWVYLMLIAVLGFVIWRQTNKADNATLADFQTGKLN